MWLKVEPVSIHNTRFLGQNGNFGGDEFLAFSEVCGLELVSSLSGGRGSGKQQMPVSLLVA